MFIIVFASTVILNFTENSMIMNLKNTSDSSQCMVKANRFCKTKKLNPLLKRAAIKILITV